METQFRTLCQWEVVNRKLTAPVLVDPINVPPHEPPDPLPYVSSTGNVFAASAKLNGKHHFAWSWVYEVYQYWSSECSVHYFDYRPIKW